MTGARKPLRQFSAGGVVLRSGRGGLRSALISRAGNTVWCLPKGLIQKGESVEEAALREVREETGLTARLLRKVGDVQYRFVSERSKRKVFKKVSFFLMRYVRGSTRDHDFEVDAATWFPVREALRKMSYLTERRIVEKAARLWHETTRDR